MDNSQHRSSRQGGDRDRPDNTQTGNASNERKENCAPTNSNWSRDEGYGQQSGSYRHKDAADNRQEHYTQNRQHIKPDHNHSFYGANHPGEEGDSRSLRSSDRRSDEAKKRNLAGSTQDADSQHLKNNNAED